MKKITIVSGKGGVGKSTISASLAIELAKTKKIIAVDCDIEASNLPLVLGITRENLEKKEKISTNEIAEIDESKCTSCKACYEACYFNAIEWINNKPRVKEFGCEGCGVCAMVCPDDAIRMEKVYNATIGYAWTKYGFKVVSGQLEMGEGGSGRVVMVVKEFAEKIDPNNEVMVIDAAAGIGCQVIASISGSDYVIAVTEPTPSGFSDLQRVLQVVEHFRVPYGIIINKYDINKKETNRIEKYALERLINVITKIPYDKKMIDALVKLTPIIEYEKSYEEVFKKIVDYLIREGAL